MGEEAKSKRDCHYYLPQHLLSEILLKLSAKSLFRFKSVSKDWADMISDSDFEELNFQHCTSKISIMYQIEDDYSYESFKLDGKGGTIAKKIASFNFKAGKYETMGMDLCHNLILLKAESYPLQVTRLSIYDVVTQRQKQQLPEIPEHYSNTRTCSLVYDASTHKYKVVVFKIHAGNNWLDMCYIHTLDQRIEQSKSNKKKTWRVSKPTCPQKINIPCSPVAIDGVLHWVAQGYDSAATDYIQMMDIRTEKFIERIVKLPCQGQSGSFSADFYLFEMKASLAVFHTDPEYGYKFDIWVLKDSVQSLWVKQHRIPATFVTPSMVAVALKSYDPCLVVEGCNGTTYVLLSDLNYELYWYNVNNQEIRRIALDYYNFVRSPFFPSFLCFIRKH